jgi:benzoylformate decarboxylase
LRNALSFEQKRSPDQAAKVRERVARHVAKHDAAREKLKTQITAQRDIRPLTPLGLMGALANVLPHDVAVVEEAGDDDEHDVRAAGRSEKHDRLFWAPRMGAGMGIGVAIGAKLAWPERPVLALLGEGAAAYGVQGLWSAARYKVQSSL